MPAQPQRGPYAYQPRPPAPNGWQPVPAPKQASYPLMAPAPAMPVNAAMAMEAAPRPTFRGQAPETVTVAPPAPLALPSPEQLGLNVAAPLPPAAVADIDWNAVQQRLRGLNAVEFHLVRVGANQWRATFLVPVSAQQTRQVEAFAGSDAAATLAALQQAETLLARR